MQIAQSSSDRRERGRAKADEDLEDEVGDVSRISTKTFGEGRAQHARDGFIRKQRKQARRITEAIAALEIGKSENRRCSRHRVKTSNNGRNEGSPGVGRVTGGRRGRRRKIKRRMERRDGWWSDGNGREDSGAARWCIVNGTSSRRRGMQKHGVFRS